MVKEISGVQTIDRAKEQSEEKKEIIGSQISPKMTDRAWITIDRANLLHNVKELQSIMKKGCKLMAVVKANAYGHGSTEISDCLNKAGVKNFAVATLREGIELRQKGIAGEILILGYTDPALAKELSEFNLTQTIIDYDYGRELEAKKIPIKVHLKIDTGMHRLGIEADSFEQVHKIISMRYLRVTGMFTHLCTADGRNTEDRSFTKKQIENFKNLNTKLRATGIFLPVHIQSTYGLLNYNELTCDYARIGMGMYGSLSSARDKTVLKPDLRPVLTLKTRLVLIRKLPAGESVGYGRAFLAEKDRLIGILAIGYGDGYPRELSDGSGEAIINGIKVPVIGRICMDQLLVDLTEVPGVKRGAVAVLIGKSGEKCIGADEVADKAGTIANELLSRLGSRLQRVYE